MLHTPVAVWGLQGGGIAAVADTVFFVMMSLGIENQVISQVMYWILYLH